MQQLARSVRPAWPWLAVAAMACGGDLTLPEVSGEGYELAVVGGNGQTGTVGEALPDPLVVEVRGNQGLAVAGRKVAFIPDAAGGFTPDTAETDDQGLARARWVLGPTVGSYSATVRLVATGDSAPSKAVAATAVASQPDTLRGVSGVVQGGRRGQPLGQPLVVAVVDRFGNPVTGVEVSWAVTDGEGELSDRATRTGVDGQTSVTWTLGKHSFLQHVSASLDGVSGSPVIFTATVLF
jgi:Big-like domain-containing protein